MRISYRPTLMLIVAAAMGDQPVAATSLARWNARAICGLALSQALFEHFMTPDLNSGLPLSNRLASAQTSPIAKPTLSWSVSRPEGRARSRSA